MDVIPEHARHWVELTLENVGNWWRGYCYWSPESADHQEWIKQNQIELGDAAAREARRRSRPDPGGFRPATAEDPAS